MGEPSGYFQHPPPQAGLPSHWAGAPTFGESVSSPFPFWQWWWRAGPGHSSLWPAPACLLWVGIGPYQHQWHSIPRSTAARGPSWGWCNPLLLQARVLWFPGLQLECCTPPPYQTVDHPVNVTETTCAPGEPSAIQAGTCNCFFTKTHSPNGYSEALLMTGTISSPSEKSRI